MMGEKDTEDTITKVHDPNVPTSVAEVVRDVVDEEATKKRALRDLNRGYGELRSLYSPHTLAPAEGHAHHLIIEDMDSVQSSITKMVYTSFRAVCRICAGVDRWTTVEPVSDNRVRL